MKERIRTVLHNTSNRINEPLRAVLAEALEHIEQLEKSSQGWKEGGLWLLSDETDLRVLVERTPGEWVEVICVPYQIDGIISHIVEPAGIEQCLLTKQPHIP